MDTKAVIEKIGRSVVEAAHRHFMEGHLDNSEHISAVKKSILAVGKTAGEILGLEVGSQISTDLIDYSRQLFIDTWLQLAEEDGDSKGAAIERKEAVMTFDEIYSSDEDSID